MKVAFFIYDEWAFGSIHRALVKEFYKRDIYSDLIPWQKKYTDKEWNCLVNTYDIWVSTPGESLKYLLKHGVDKKQIVMISHSGWDVSECLKYHNDLHNLKGYGVICKSLIEYSKSKGITADIKLLQNGISFENFYREPAQSLETIGYAGKSKWVNHFDNVKDYKRMYLALQMAYETKSRFLVAGKMTHYSMSGFYKDIDCLIVSSDESEACGLPLMEAAAAGRLPLAANVGINADMKNPTGIVVPVDPAGFVNVGTKSILELRDNTELFQKKCIEAQDFAREYYDWSKVIDPWIDLIVGG